MNMVDISNVPQLTHGSGNNSAYFQEASWYVKRLILKQQLTKQVRQNEQNAVDTSVIVYDLTDKKKVYSYNVDYVHYAASISKLFVTSVLLDELRAGNATLDTVVTWDPSDRRAGAGIYDGDSSPLSATIEDVLFDMLNRSGNTAVRILVNKVLGGAAAVNERYEQDYPKLQVTRLQPLASDPSKFLLGYTTPAETDYILTHLSKEKDSYAGFVKNALATNIFDDYGPRSQVKDHENITVIDKQGQLNDPEGNNRHDVGFIENARNKHKLRYVLMTTNYENPAGEATEKAIVSLQEFGRDMLRFEGDRTPKAQNPPTLKAQSHAIIEQGRTIY